MNNCKKIKTAISLSIVLSSINFCIPVQAGGILSAIQALERGTILKVVKQSVGGAARSQGKKWGREYVINHMKLDNGQEVKVCQDIQSDGKLGSPYYCQ